MNQSAGLRKSTKLVKHSKVDRAINMQAYQLNAFGRVLSQNSGAGD